MIDWTDEALYGKRVDLEREAPECRHRLRGVYVDLCTVRSMLEPFSEHSRSQEALLTLQRWLIETTRLPESAMLVRVSLMNERLAYLCVLTDASFPELGPGSMIPLAWYEDIRLGVCIPEQYHERIFH